jgi:hypothetical protein
VVDKLEDIHLSFGHQDSRVNSQNGIIKNAVNQCLGSCTMPTGCSQ